MREWVNNFLNVLNKIKIKYYKKIIYKYLYLIRDGLIRLLFKVIINYMMEMYNNFMYNLC